MALARLDQVSFVLLVYTTLGVPVSRAGLSALAQHLISTVYPMLRHDWSHHLLGPIAPPAGRWRSVGRLRQRIWLFSQG